MIDPEFTPGRLVVGLVSPGKVGCSFGKGLESAGHVVGFCKVNSEVSKSRAEKFFSQAIIFEDWSGLVGAELIVLAVPDTALTEVVSKLVGVIKPGTIVVHVSGVYGVEVLTPLAKIGATCVALHPIVAFNDDAVSLNGVFFGLTADTEAGWAIGEMIALELGGFAVRVQEDKRGLYHASIAYAGNMLVPIVSDAVNALEKALDDGVGVRTAQAMLKPLLEVSLNNALDKGILGLTGPVARKDDVVVDKHVQELSSYDTQCGELYRKLADRARKLRFG